MDKYPCEILPDPLENKISEVRSRFKEIAKDR